MHCVQFFPQKTQDSLTTVESGLEGTIDSSHPSQETIDSTLGLPFDADSWLDVKEKVKLGVMSRPLIVS